MIPTQKDDAAQDAQEPCASHTCSKTRFKKKTPSTLLFVATVLEIQVLLCFWYGCARLWCNARLDSISKINVVIDDQTSLSI